MARPTEFNDELLNKARQYLANLPEDEVVHSIEGLALFVGIARSTVYEWQKNFSEFSDIVDEVLAKQAKKLANSGLDNKFNASITKLMLTKHGYSDKQEVDTNLKADIDAKITGMKIIYDGSGVQNQEQETVGSGPVLD